MHNIVEQYKSNRNLKPANVSVQFTEEQVLEYIKCKKDPIYFIEKYVKIMTIDHGLTDFSMYKWQKKFVKMMHNGRYTIVNTGRQVGKSQTAAGYLLHYILFNSDRTAAILANKAATAKEIFWRVQIAYEYLPKWLQAGVVAWNKTSLELENGSRLISSATSTSAIRGMTISFLYLDEFAHVMPNLATEFYTSVYPTISSGRKSKIVVTSTPNGIGNLFWRLFTDAKEKQNKFQFYNGNWRDVPWRDEEWAREQRSNCTSEQQWQQEHEAEFMGSANTLISGNKLQCLTGVKPAEITKYGVKIYEHPEKDRQYVLSCDTSEGVGQDNHAITVTDITEIPYKQVATFKSNQIKTPLLPALIKHIGDAYNQAWVFIELNGTGEAVARSLFYDLEYQSLLCTAKRGRLGQVLTAFRGPRYVQLGVKTSKTTKAVGCNWLKDLIENDKYLIRDRDTIEELAVFTSQNSTYKATQGNKDDTVMTLVLFAWLTSQKYFKKLTEYNLRDKLWSEREAAIEADLQPFGVRVGGDAAASEPESFVADGDRWFVIDDEKNYKSANKHRYGESFINTYFNYLR